MTRSQLLEDAVQEIAVIDDDPLICELIVDALGNSGTVVKCARRGRSGRKLLTSKHFDLAIIDIVLPDASGIALAAIAANENTPVLFITAHTKATARLKQYDLLDVPCLPKPFDLVRLRAETEQVIAASRHNIQRIKDGMARWHACLIALDNTMAESRLLIDISRRLCGRSDGA
jgi:DNA-binding response OmpR family regulator